MERSPHCVGFALAIYTLMYILATIFCIVRGGFSLYTVAISVQIHGEHGEATGQDWAVAVSCLHI